MCDAYVGDSVLEERFPVIVVAQIDLFVEQFVQESSYCESLFAE